MQRYETSLEDHSQVARAMYLAVCTSRHRLDEYFQGVVQPPDADLTAVGRVLTVRGRAHALFWWAEGAGLAE